MTKPAGQAEAFSQPFTQAGPDRAERLLTAWYEGRWWLALLWPLAQLFSVLAEWRRRRQSARAVALSAPVIVVGNIALGGTGKTPLIITLAQHLQGLGLRPGVLSRGYGGKAPHYPFFVDADTSVSESGDEPLLIAMEAGCPVMVGSDRIASARALIDEHRCNILLSDDGLQHYRLSRQWEMCVVDGSRGLGNGWCLPAGPLREPPKRLNEVDCVVVNGQLSASLPVSSFSMQLRAESWRSVADGAVCPLEPVPWEDDANSLQAVTGIGNPERFFRTLRSLGLQPQTRSFPDHHPFAASDLSYVGASTLLMTAKDAVKCRGLADESGSSQLWWYLSVSAQLPPAFYDLLHTFLSQQNLKPLPIESAP